MAQHIIYRFKTSMIMLIFATMAMPSLAYDKRIVGDWVTVELTFNDTIIIPLDTNVNEHHPAMSFEVMRIRDSVNGEIWNLARYDSCTIHVNCIFEELTDSTYLRNCNNMVSSGKYKITGEYLVLEVHGCIGRISTKYKKINRKVPFPMWPKTICEF